MNRVKAVLQYLRDNEPVRTVVYFVAGVIVAQFVVRGWLDANTSLLLLGALGVAIGVPTAELTRKLVTPAGKARTIIEGEVADRVDAAVEAGTREANAALAKVDEAARDLSVKVQANVAQLGQVLPLQPEQIVAAADSIRHTVEAYVGRHRRV